MKTNKNLLLILTCLVSLSCRPQEFSNKCLQEVFDSVTPSALGDSIIFDLGRSINCFEWDSVLLSDPYYSKKWIYDRTNVEVPPFPYLDDENHSYLFFIKNNLVIRSFKISRGQIDLTSIIYDRINGYNFYDKSTKLVIYVSDRKFTSGKDIVDAKILE